MTFGADRLTDIERRLTALERRARLPDEPKQSGQSKEEFLVQVLAALLANWNAPLNIDHALANIRSHRFDSELIKIFTKGIPQR